MLIRYVVENFLSFNEEVEISLISNKERRKAGHFVKTKDINVLKTAVIYGANASGKSNLIKSISFSSNMIKLGIDKVPFDQCYFRLARNNEQSPSKFHYEIKVGETYYSYGFGVILEKRMIVEEWLYQISSSGEKKIFERYKADDGKQKVEFGINLSGEVKNRFKVYQADMEYSDNLLFLSEINRKSTSNLKEFVPFKDVYDWFNQKLVVLTPDSRYGGLDFIGDNKDLTNVFNGFLDVFETGINNITSEEVDFEKLEIPDHLRRGVLSDIEKTNVIIFQIEGSRYSLIKHDGEYTVRKIGLEHQTFEGDKVIFDIENESDGTQRLFDFIPAIHQLVNAPKIFLIDELDRSLHSKLTYELMNLFLELTSGNESQLIVTTHESLLLDLDLLRRDEIWFVEKENDASKLYSLDEFKVRNDKAIRKDYLLGRYGAIPIFKSFDNLNL
jgi:uncharacterized protein